MSTTPTKDEGAECPGSPDGHHCVDFPGAECCYCLMTRPLTKSEDVGAQVSSLIRKVRLHVTSSLDIDELEAQILQLIEEASKDKAIYELTYARPDKEWLLERAKWLKGNQ